jgi:hypothetical protein
MRAKCLLLLSVLCSGCATFGAHQMARPIDKGSLQLGIESGMWHVRDSGAAPVANLTARYGFGRSWDLGVRAGSAGVGVAGKVALTPPDSGLWVVALAPSLSALPWGTRPIQAQLPLVIGLEVGPHELTLTPELQAWSRQRNVPSPRRRTAVISAGLSVGASVRIAPGVRLVPEVSFVRPLVGGLRTRAAFSDVELRPGRPLYQVSLGVLLGGERDWWLRKYNPWYTPAPYEY